MQPVNFIVAIRISFFMSNLWVFLFTIWTSMVWCLNFASELEMELDTLIKSKDCPRQLAEESQLCWFREVPTTWKNNEAGWYGCKVQVYNENQGNKKRI